MPDAYSAIHFHYETPVHTDERKLIGVQSVTYFGHRLTPNGATVIDSKIEAYLNYSTPKNKSAVK